MNAAYNEIYCFISLVIKCVAVNISVIQSFPEKRIRS